MRRRAVLGSALAVGLALAGALVGGPRTLGVAAQDATPTASVAADARFPAAVGLPELRIRTTETAFEGVPAELAAGRYLVTFTNGFADPTGATEGTGVEFYRLPEDETFEAYVAGWEEFRANLANAGPLPDGPDAAYFEAYQAGGPFAVFPGQTVQGIVELPPGEYAVWNDSPFHPQRPVHLRVTGDGETPAAEAVPAADVTIRHGETAGGHAMEIEGELRAGPQTVEFVNAGDQTHYAWFGRAPGPVTAEQVVRAWDVGEGGTPPADVGFDPEAVELVALTQTQSAGTTQWMALNLEPGTYVVACFAFDPTDDNSLHAFAGELEVVNVR